MATSTQPAGRQAQKIVDEAKQVLYGNLKTGYSRWASREYKYVSPSRGHYFHQWFWDSCFIAIVLSHFDIGLAKNEIRSLLAAQRQDGFIPHIIYWGQRKHFSILSRLGSHLEAKLAISPRTTDRGSSTTHSRAAQRSRTPRGTPSARRPGTRW